jgi:integrase
MLKPQRNGNLREFWYGIYTDSEGKRKVINLDVKWTGTPPSSGKVSDVGDAAFERSRVKAEEALAVFSEDAKRKGRAEHLTERLIESKTGRAVEYTRIADLPARWRNLGRESTPTERHLYSCDTHLRRFISFMAVKNPSATYLYEVTETDASAYVAQCRVTLAPATAKVTIHLIRQAMARFLPVGASNPFSSIVSRRANGDRGVIHRKPFTPEELRALLDAAKGDTFLYPLVVCAAMTGMRLGDVCNLKWSSVDLASGMIAVKTSKTEKQVEIPIFAPLRSVLEGLGEKARGNVFPSAAEMHKNNADGLTWRFKKIVVTAFSHELPASITERVPASDILDDGLALIRTKIPDSKRRDRMIMVLQQYAAGSSIKQI